MKKKFDVSIIQPGYIPWLGFFDLLKLADVFVIYDDVQFDRRGWRNRNRILSPNGKPHWLTIPVEKKGNYNQLIKDVKIVDENWAKNHLETIRHFYRKAPHFNSIFPDLDEAFKSKTLSLIDICLNIIRSLAPILAIDFELIHSSEIDSNVVGKTERLVEICNKLEARRYISPDVSASYINPKLFNNERIELIYQNYPHPKYKQFDNQFVSHLSVVDALMFCGRKASQFVGISHTKIH